MEWEWLDDIDELKKKFPEQSQETLEYFLKHTKNEIEESLKDAKKYDKLLEYDRAISEREFAIMEMTGSPFLGEEIILQLILKNAKAYEKILNYDKAINAYYDAFMLNHNSPLRNVLGSNNEDEKNFFTQVYRITGLINNDNIEHLGNEYEDWESTTKIWDDILNYYKFANEQELEQYINRLIKIAELMLEKKHHEKALLLYEMIGGIDSDVEKDIVKIKKSIANEKAKKHEKLLEFEKAAEIYKKYEMEEDVIRVRKAAQVNQTVVHGDQVTKTEIKDSVLNRSNVGTGSTKAEELREAKALLDDGIIDDDEFKQMKKEILGK